MGKGPLRLVELYLDGEHAVGNYGNIVVATSAATPRKALLDRYVSKVRSVKDAYPRGIGTLVIVASDEPPPDAEGRRAIYECNQALASLAMVAVYVIVGRGFVSAAKRGVITAMNMTARHGLPLRVVATAEEAFPVLKKDLGGAWLEGVESAGLVTALAELRRAFDHRAKAG